MLVMGMLPPEVTEGSDRNLPGLEGAGRVVAVGEGDSDFAVGGTNVKGYTLGAALALSSRVSVSLRWMGATQIAGPPLKSDVVLFDLSAKF